MNFIIDVKVYPVDVMVSIRQSNEEVIKDIKKWKITKAEKKNFIANLEEEEEKTFGLTHHIPGTGLILIRLYEGIKKPSDHGNLAHEIFHAVEYMAKFVGLKHCEKSSEAFAYGISFLTEEIYKKIKCTSIKP